jgi:hypothetical protein
MNCPHFGIDESMVYFRKKLIIIVIINFNNNLSTKELSVLSSNCTGLSCNI